MRLFLGNSPQNADVGTQNIISRPRTTGAAISSSKVQAAKPTRPGQTREYSTLRPKKDNMEPQDVTASSSSLESGHGALNSTNTPETIGKSGRTNDFTDNRKSIGKIIADRVSRDNENKKYYKLYQLLGNPNFLHGCYKKIKSSTGALAKGSSPETLDGITINKLEKMASDIMTGRYKFSPDRRLMIPKPNKPGKFRPLGIGSPLEKIVLTGMTEILKVIYEPIFLDVSHGFRPEKSVKTALHHLYKHGGPYV